jgi:iron complex transport system permease protein
MGIAYLVCLSAAWILAPGVDVMSLGDDAARALGVDVGRSYRLILILISILIGSAISFGGPLPFLGLVAPHMARLISKQQLRTVLIISSLLGAILAVTADLAARTVRSPVDMDVGLITTMIGAPYFLWLLVRRATT